MGDPTTAAAIEADLLAVYRVDLLDLYRGRLSYRRVCLLVEHLPPDAAVWRTAGPDAGWTRSEHLLLALERRVTALWATVAAVFGQPPREDQLAGPFDALTRSRATSPVGEAEVMSLRDMALMMRGS